MGSCGRLASTNVLEDRGDDIGIFDAGDDAQFTAALGAGLDDAIERRLFRSVAFVDVAVGTAGSKQSSQPASAWVDKAGRRWTTRLSAWAVPGWRRRARFDVSFEIVYPIATRSFGRTSGSNEHISVELAARVFPDIVGTMIERQHNTLNALIKELTENEIQNANTTEPQ